MMIVRKTLLLASIWAFLPMFNGYAQDVKKIFDEVSHIIGNEQYEEANTLLCSIDETQLTTLSDSLEYYIFKGTCLRQLFRYEEAIPFLKKAIHLMEKRPEYFGDYIGSLYMLGNCYNIQGKCDTAERFLKKVLILDYEDAYKLNTSALYDLTEIYNQQGYTELAIECADRIRKGLDSDSLLTEEKWKDRVKMLYDLALFYEEKGKDDKEIATYYLILGTINNNAGKGNDDYLFYSYALFARLLYYNLNEKAIAILEEMIILGRGVEANSVWICKAYVNYLILMARNNEVDLVRVLLKEAKEYFQKTKNFEYNKEMLCNLYYMIGDAFSEAGNFAEGARYRLYRFSSKLDS